MRSRTKLSGLLFGVFGLACSSAESAAVSDAGATEAAAPAPSATTSATTSPPPRSTAGGTFDVGTCPAAKHCGGDLLGAWDVVGGCQPTAMILCGAAEAQVTRDNVISGTLVVDATTMTWDVTNRGHTDATLAPSCAGGATDCSSLATTLTHRTDIRGRFDHRAAECTGAGPCACSWDYDLGISGAHAYATSGVSSLKMGYFTDNAPGEEYEYCVEGDALTLVQGSPTNDTGYFQIRLRRHR